MQIITKIGQRSQVVIPIEMRKALELQEGDHIVIERKGKNLILRKLQIPLDSLADQKAGASVTGVLSILEDAHPHHFNFKHFTNGNLEKPTQTELQNFVQNNVIINQTLLVNELLNSGIASYEDITNFHHTKKEAEEMGLDEEDTKEIFEWWVVSDWLLEKLEKRGEVVLKTDYQDWWGRGTTGQSITLDPVIEDIYKDL